MSSDKGLDGTGMKSSKGITPGESVDKTVRTDVPGGESSGIKATGPNAPKSGGKVKK